MMFSTLLRMTRVIRKLFLALFGLTYFTCAQASDFGASLWVPIFTKDPTDMHGYRGALTYQPKGLISKHFSVYFDASYAHWWVNGDGPSRSISIASVAPYLRMYFFKKPYFSPYLEASVGPAYVNKTRFDNRNLGIHYIFQDQATVGAAFGKDQQFYAAFTIMHYSNCSLASSNAGITAPLVFNIGYRF